MNGLSLYIEADNVKVLFDAGPDPGLLPCNVATMGINLTQLNAVIISHEHSDHVGGLKAISDLNESIPVYIPKGMSFSAKSQVMG